MTALGAHRAPLQWNHLRLLRPPLCLCVFVVTFRLNNAVIVHDFAANDRQQ